MSLVLSDEPWQDIGFKRRPKYGAFFQRFRRPWRVALEDAIAREMLILFTGAHIAAGLARREQIEELISIYVRGPDGSSDLWKSFGYASRTETENHLDSSIATYLDSGIQEWL
jgi:hypothetical protein